MGNRKSLSKRVRFEVFKRDSFSCQYCGAKAPDVVLHVDHIQPVAEGGDNDLLNLVTACVGCNSGKAAVPLSDQSALEKQRAQLEELQARREQIELMLEWHRGLKACESQESDAAVAHIEGLLDRSRLSLTEQGRKDIVKLVKRFGMLEVIASADIAFDHYEDPKVALDKIGGVAFNRKLKREDPRAAQRQQILYVVKRSYSFAKGWIAEELLAQAFDLGIDVDWLKRIAPNCTSWTAWRETMESAIDDAREKQNQSAETH